MNESKMMPVSDNQKNHSSGEYWLTVIIPVFNDGAVALNAVNAILTSGQQGTLEGVEILCVEGGSNDDSHERLKEYSKTKNNVAVIPCPSGAVSPKFNLGARQARGRWLAFTESDCIPDPGWIPAIKKTVDEDQLKACAGRVRAYSDDPNLQLSIRDFNDRRVVRPTFYNKIVCFYHGQGNNFLIEKKLFLEIGGVDERLGAGAPAQSGQDAELNFRLLHAGINIGFDPNQLIVHYPRETRESFLRKKRNYYYADVWWRVVVHPTKLASLSGIILRFFYPLWGMLLSLVTLKFNDVERHAQEWRGFGAGLWNGMLYAISHRKINNR